MLTYVIIAVTVLVSWRAFNDQRLLGRLILRGRPPCSATASTTAC